MRDYVNRAQREEESCGFELFSFIDFPRTDFTEIIIATWT